MRSATGFGEAVRRRDAWDHARAGAHRAWRRSVWVPLSRAGTVARTSLTREGARRLHHSAGLLAAEAWLEKAHEYYRGDAHDKLQLTPLWAATLSFFANLHGASDRSRASSAVRTLVFVTAGLVGVSEVSLSVRRAVRRHDGQLWPALWSVGPGGGVSGALWLSGLLGLFAERVRNTPAHRAPTFLGVHAGRVVGFATAAGLMGANRGAVFLRPRRVFQNPLMSVPLMLPPVAAAFVARASQDPYARAPRTARISLWVTVGAGLAAAGLRAYGAARTSAGGAKGRGFGRALASIPTPPRSTAWALAGLAALVLLKDVSYTRSPRATQSPRAAGVRVALACA